MAIGQVFDDVSRATAEAQALATYWHRDYVLWRAGNLYLPIPDGETVRT